MPDLPDRLACFAPRPADRHGRLRSGYRADRQRRRAVRHDRDGEPRPRARQAGAGRLRAAGPRSRMGLCPCPRASATRSSRSLGSRARERRADAGDPDGIAGFLRRGGNGSVLVNNHEVGGSEPHPRAADPGLRLRPQAAGGGTTTIEVDRHGNRVREYVSLAGTHNNCAGGRTPWNTWLTCEETEAILGKRPRLRLRGRPLRPAANRDPQPIKALGRYAHESSLSTRAGAIYLTEDAGNPNGLLYRFTPPRRRCRWPRLPAAAGRRRRPARGDERVHARR